MLTCGLHCLRLVQFMFLFGLFLLMFVLPRGLGRLCSIVLILLWKFSFGCICHHSLVWDFFEFMCLHVSSLDFRVLKILMRKLEKTKKKKHKFSRCSLVERQMSSFNDSSQFSLNACPWIRDTQFLIRLSIWVN